MVSRNRTPYGGAVFLLVNRSVILEACGTQFEGLQALAWCALEVKEHWLFNHRPLAELEGAISNQIHNMNGMKMAPSQYLTKASRKYRLL